MKTFKTLYWIKASRHKKEYTVRFHLYEVQKQVKLKFKKNCAVAVLGTKTDEMGIQGLSGATGIFYTVI